METKVKVDRDYFPEPFSGCLSAIFLLVTVSAAAAIILIIMWVLS